jgi:hypothetical protein
MRRLLAIVFIRGHIRQGRKSSVGAGICHCRESDGNEGCRHSNRNHRYSTED